mmetsp:Transcript_39945/g.78544  ORF Transcript_39945/g.78544 Transcript_39945/m.78544 type:complete len:1497 (-) Transcript_39945:199-4689(-)
MRRPILLLLFLVALCSAQLLKVGLLDVQTQSVVRNAFDLAVKKSGQNKAFTLVGEPVLIPEGEESTKNLILRGSLMVNDPNFLALLGASVSTMTKDIHILAKGGGKPHVGFNAGDPSLTNQVEYPTFLRLNPSLSVQCFALMQFIRAHGWSRISVIKGLQYSTVGPFIEDIANDYGVGIVSHANLARPSGSDMRQCYTDLQLDSPDGLTKVGNTSLACKPVRDALSMIAQGGASIVALFVSREEFLPLVLMARQWGLSGSEANFLRTWILVEDALDWGINNEGINIGRAVQGMISMRWAVDAESFTRFKEDMTATGVREEDVTVQSAFVFDAVRAVAEAASKIPNPLDGLALYEVLLQNKIPAALTATGAVQLNQDGERFLPIDFYNAPDDTGNFVKVAEWTLPSIETINAWEATRNNKTAFMQMRCDSTKEQYCPSGLLCDGNLLMFSCTKNSLGVRNMRDCPCPKSPEGHNNFPAFLTMSVGTPIVWGSKTTDKPTGASTFVDIAIISNMFPVPIKGFGSDEESFWADEIKQSINEINASPNLLRQITLRQNVFQFEDKAQLLITTGEALRGPLTVAAFSPAPRSDFVEATLPIMTSFARPSINYGSGTSFCARNNDTAALYPLYAATFPNDDIIAAATARLVRYLNWRHVLFMISGDLRKQTLVERRFGNARTIAARSFDINDSPEALKAKLEDLRKTGVRNIVSWVDDPALFKRILRVSLDVGLASAESHNHTWIVPAFDIVDSVRFNADLYYEPRLQLSLQGMMFMYPYFNITQPPVPRGVNADLGAFKNSLAQRLPGLVFETENAQVHPEASTRTIFARDAVYLVAFALERLLQRNKDPLSGVDFAEGLRNNSYQYSLLNQAQRPSKAGYSVLDTMFVSTHDITIDGTGNRRMSMRIKNVDIDGRMQDVGYWDHRTDDLVMGAPSFNNPNFADGTNSPPRDVICDWNQYFNGTSGIEECRTCGDGEPTFAFIEKDWKCGKLKLPGSDDPTIYIIVIWIAGTCLAAFIFLFLWWRYRRWVKMMKKRNAGKWQLAARKDLLRSLRLDAFIGFFNIAVELFDVGTNVVVGLAFLEIEDPRFLNLTMAYWIFFISGLLFVIIYLRKHFQSWRQTCLDYSKAGVAKLDDFKLRAFSQRRIQGERRGSLTIKDLAEKDTYESSRIRLKKLIVQTRFTLFLAFAEDAVMVGFCLIYIYYVEKVAVMEDSIRIKNNPRVFLSLLWSTVQFGLKLSSWRDMMFLSEKYAWLAITHEKKAEKKIQSQLRSQQENSMYDASPGPMSANKSRSRQQDLDQDLLNAGFSPAKGTPSKSNMKSPPRKGEQQGLLDEVKEDGADLDASNRAPPPDPDQYPAIDGFDTATDDQQYTDEVDGRDDSRSFDDDESRDRGSSLDFERDADNIREYRPKARTTGDYSDDTDGRASVDTYGRAYDSRDDYSEDQYGNGRSADPYNDYNNDPYATDETGFSNATGSTYINQGGRMGDIIENDYSDSEQYSTN